MPFDWNPKKSVRLLLIIAAFVMSSSRLLAEQQLGPTKKKTVVVGSKRFAENYLIAEMFSLLLEEQGISVTRKFGLGGTMVAYRALKESEIDVYPDYTGTVLEAILKLKYDQVSHMNARLKPLGIEALGPLGFSNSYALVVRQSMADRLNLSKISDLRSYPQLKGALSFEFLNRSDGWPGMKKSYQLQNQVKGLDVPLTYEALSQGDVDFVEAYTTEPLILKNKFKVLIDDIHYLPKYEAIPLVSKKLDPTIKETLNQLQGRISLDQILLLNSLVVDGVAVKQVAQDFLFKEGLVKRKKLTHSDERFQWVKLLSRVQTHIYLTLLAVLLATLFSVPLAIAIAPLKKTSQLLLGLAGVLQTIPSIALLSFMIPFFGIGFKPAIVGLFIYSLLPILRNTHIAMTTIDPNLINAAKGIGLYPYEVLLSVKIPLAFPTILAGIRTATILNIGTATLAAFIGAGGLGEPIVTGLALNDSQLILQGAIPAAILAIVIDTIFAMIQKVFVKEI